MQLNDCVKVFTNLTNVNAFDWSIMNDRIKIVKSTTLD